MTDNVDENIRVGLTNDEKVRMRGGKVFCGCCGTPNLLFQQIHMPYSGCFFKMDYTDDGTPVFYMSEKREWNWLVPVECPEGSPSGRTCYESTSVELKWGPWPNMWFGNDTECPPSDLDTSSWYPPVPEDKWEEYDVQAITLGFEDPWSREQFLSGSLANFESIQFSEDDLHTPVLTSVPESPYNFTPTITDFTSEASFESEFPVAYSYINNTEDARSASAIYAKCRYKWVAPKLINGQHFEITWSVVNSAGETSSETWSTSISEKESDWYVVPFPALDGTPIEDGDWTAYVSYITNVNYK